MIVAYFWRIKPSRLPFAIKAMGFDRFSLLRDKNVSFHKSLGTGKGETFTPSDAHALQWGLVAVVEDIEKFDSSAVVKRWRKGSVSEFRAVLEPISSHGKWAGKEPFVATAKDWDGQVAAITRARIKWSQNFRFWRSVPPVTVSLKAAPGLVAAIGIGEAPIGLQGTFRCGNLRPQFEILHIRVPRIKRRLQIHRPITGIQRSYLLDLLCVKYAGLCSNCLK